MKKLFAGATLKRFLSVHSWVGIVAGVALFISFFCGAFTMYDAALTHWTNPALRRGSGNVGLIDRLVQKAADTPDARGNFSIDLGEAGQGPKATFFTSGAGLSNAPSLAVNEHAEIIGLDGLPPSEHTTLALNAQGEVVRQETISYIGFLFNEFHYAIGLPREFGYTFMGFISLLYGLALVTGLIIYLPTIAADIYALRVSAKYVKKMWRDAHNAVGVVSLPFHLMIALTALLLCFGVIGSMGDMMTIFTPSKQPRQAYLERFGPGGRTQIKGETGAPPAKAAMLPPGEILKIAKAALPRMEPRSIGYRNYGTDRAQATVQGRFHDAVITSGWIQISPVSGNIGRIDAPDNRDAGRLLFGYRELHIGDYGGGLLRAIYFLMGLAGAFLFYSGNLVWIESRRRQAHLDPPKSTRIAAQLTVGACLGCCLGIGLMLAGNKLFPAGMALRAEWERNLYYVGFLGALLWSLGRAPIRSAIELLSACAVTYLALPILNGIVTGDHLPRAVREGLWDIVLVDSIFLLLAVSFFAMARAAVRRSKIAQKNSVWSLAPKQDSREASSVPIDAPQVPAMQSAGDLTASSAAEPVPAASGSPRS
jgi:uncharacterized iron-regulated membrane protein